MYLSIDIETYSSIDIKTAGAYKYAQSPDFEILLFAYSLNGEPVKVVDLAQGESIPANIITMLNDGKTKLYAYNASFEWYCLNSAGYVSNLNQWECTMIKGMYLGLTAGLDATAKILLADNIQKNTAGKNLIKYFSCPCKPSRTNGGRTRNLPRHDLDKWKTFIDYNKKDVEVEMALSNKLKNFSVPVKEWENWRDCVEMNSKGVEVEKTLVENAIGIDLINAYSLTETSKAITGLANPNSPSQLKTWLESKGISVSDLQKGTVSELLEVCQGDVSVVLENRQKLAKTSVKKYNAMLSAMCDDNRVRGLLQFYGANRTGRWAGRLVQVQNLPRNYIVDMELPREAVLKRDMDYIEVSYGDVSDTLSQLIRTAFIPKKGCKFVIADFSAIEARVIAWLAKEHWRLDVFATHGKIYEASASQMFHVPLDTIAKGHENYALRQKGKVAELALGYQGGACALVSMGALNMGLTEDELPSIVSAWRNANKRIIELWYALGNATIHVVETSTAVNCKGLIIRREIDIHNSLDFLTIELPSGRKLYYANPGLRDNSWGAKVITYNSMDQVTKKWTKTDTYGGKLTENAVQAIARDCLAVSLRRLKKAGYDVVMHIHDEVVIECPEDTDMKAVCEIMGQKIDWAEGLQLKAEAFESKFYKKD